MAADPKLIKLTAGIITAYLENNTLDGQALPGLIKAVHGALTSPAIAGAAGDQPHSLTSAQIRGSITPTALISFEDGRPYKTLRRHLSSRGLTLEAYLTKWGLPPNYPATAAAYAKRRSSIAKQMGLGRRGKGGLPLPPPPKATGRSPKKH